MPHHIKAIKDIKIAHSNIACGAAAILNDVALPHLEGLRIQHLERGCDKIREIDIGVSNALTNLLADLR